MAKPLTFEGALAAGSVWLELRWCDYAMPRERVEALGDWMRLRHHSSIECHPRAHYGASWRCWDAQPTPEEMMEEPWAAPPPYPVEAWRYPIAEAPYVWTGKAEAHARKLNLEPRIAGAVAMFGGRPLTGDCENPMCAPAYGWRQRGYIEPRRGDPFDLDTLMRLEG